MSSRSLENMLAVLVATVTAGAVHWVVPYTEIDMLAGGFLLRWLGLAAGAGLIVRWITRASAPRAVLLVTTGYAVAVLGRVVVEAGFLDRTGHNLWPLELLIGMGVGALGGLAGAVLARPAGPAGQ